MFNKFGIALILFLNCALAQAQSGYTANGVVRHGEVRAQADNFTDPNWGVVDIDPLSYYSGTNQKHLFAQVNKNSGGNSAAVDTSLTTSVFNNAAVINGKMLWDIEYGPMFAHASGSNIITSLSRVTFDQIHSFLYNTTAPPALKDSPTARYIVRLGEPPDITGQNNRIMKEAYELKLTNTTTTGFSYVRVTFSSDAQNPEWVVRTVQNGFVFPEQKFDGTLPLFGYGYIHVNANDNQFVTMKASKTDDLVGVYSDDQANWTATLDTRIEFEMVEPTNIVEQIRLAGDWIEDPEPSVWQIQPEW